MKTALMAGWICFGLEALILGGMIVSSKSGASSDGGMGKDLGLLFSPLVLVAGALLAWGQFLRHPYGVWGGALLSIAPVVIALGIALPNFIPNFSRMAFQSGVGTYDDPRLTKIARAMRTGDCAKERELLQGGGVDWAARDRNGVTLLGRAMKINQDMYGTPAKLEVLRILLAAGAPLAPDALRTEEFSNTDSLLMVAAAGINASVLEALLTAGGDPNFKDTDGTPLAFLSYIDFERLQLLVKYGVDVNSINPDPLGNRYSLAMYFAERGDVREAEWLVSQGANPDYKASDGTTLGMLLAARKSVAQ